MIIKKQLSSLKAYSPGKTIDEVKRQYGLTKIVKLASNENPFGCSPLVGEALATLSEKLALYPDGSAYALRQKTAQHLGVKPEQLLFGSGLDEVIQMVSRAILEEGTNVVMAKPTFSQYRHHAIIEKAELREVPLQDGVHDLESMLQQVDENTRIIWICNPNNPTGTYVSKAAIEAFLVRVPKTALVIVDEAYFEYASAPDYESALSLLPNYENLMVMRTFSKAYGIAALRMGYAVAAAGLVAQLEVARLPFNTSSTAQVGALAALEDQAFLQSCVEANQAGLQQYYDFCEKHGLKYYPSQGNFIFMELGKPGDEVFQQLLEKGYIVRSGGGLGLPEGIRITVGSAEENAEIIALLEQIVQQGVKETSL